MVAFTGSMDFRFLGLRQRNPSPSYLHHWAWAVARGVSAVPRQIHSVLCVRVHVLEYVYSVGRHALPTTSSFRF